MERHPVADRKPQAPAVSQLAGGERINLASPHKVYGPENNDLALQLRKRGIDKVVLAGMSANLCVEAHLRELLEQGFEVAVIKDATAGARRPQLGDGYEAAIVNFGYMADAVLSTDEAVSAMGSAGATGEPVTGGAVRRA